MPELPEVQTIANALSGFLTGRKFTELATRRSGMRLEFNFKKQTLLDQEIIAVRRRGRYLIIELANLEALVIHLGMSGVLRVEDRNAPLRKHEHVIFYLDDGNSLRFECPRRFGFAVQHTLKEPGGELDFLASMGPEPLTEDFNERYLYDQSRSRKTKVKNFIMDNTVVAGVGNIYASESLFAAGISPLREAGKLSMKQCAALTDAIKEVLIDAIAAGGTSISDYRRPDGTEGKFSQQLQVYGRPGLQCPRCQALISSKNIGGRNSFYCSKCQK